jgi:hypothetical protein
LSATDNTAKYYLNSAEIAVITGSWDQNIWEDRAGTFTALQLPVNTSHTIRVDFNGGVSSYGGLALVYRRN